MKKLFILLFAFILSVFCCFVCGCEKPSSPDLSRVSEIRDKIYVVDGEYFTATCFLESRENPFVSDGKAYDMKKILIVRIKPSPLLDGDCTVSLGSSSAKLVFRAEADAYVATLNAENFNPDTSLLTFETQDRKEERPFVDATPESLTAEEIYEKILAEKGKDLSLTDKEYEVRLRIISKDEKAYWYIGIVTKDKTVCYLADRNGKIIANKTTVN